MRSDIAALIGIGPAPSTTPCAILERTSEDGYDRTLIEFSAPDGDQIQAFLFQPTEVSNGGVLALHQHHSEWSLGKSEVAGLAGDPFQAFGPALARQGVTVLAPDTIGFESRMGAASGPQDLAPTRSRPGFSGDEWLQYYNHMAHRLVRGDLLMRKILVDCQAALTVLGEAVRSDSRLGVLGHSMGGGVALFLAALDDRVHVACASGAVGSYRYKLTHGIPIEMAHVIPGFAARFDVGDLLRCIAPRHLLVVSSDADPATADAVEVVEAARPIFGAMGHPDRLTHLRVSGGHDLDRARFEAVVRWLSENVDRGSRRTDE